MIQVLPPEVFNRIAAGEVVERPCSVVKELCENAIDAGASEIEIFVEGGGVKRIRITDNGCGIAKGDLKAAFLPHATSKLSRAEDLEHIATLGFRGEACASIAAVSEMKITSKTADGDCFSLSCEGGVLGEIEPASGANGTCVEVKNLFSRTPARLKFLRSNALEEGDISAAVARLILSRPNIAFTYLLNGAVRYRSFGDGEESAAAAVYGAAALESCHKIQAEKHGIRLHGFLGNQNFFKPNRAYQAFFVNGRYVLNQTLASAVANAYSSYLMKRQYPFYILYLDVPPEIVDVNVHPNKTDVRFADNRILYGTVTSIVSSVLDGSERALEYLAPNPCLPASEGESMSLERAKEEVKFVLPKSFQAATAPAAEQDLISRRWREAAEKPSSRSFTLADDAPEPWEAWEKNSSAAASAKSGREGYEKRGTLPEHNEDVFEENKKFLLEREQRKEQEKIDPKTLTFRGELFHTYLIYEAGDEAYFIDQHAAHERLLFEKLTRRLEQSAPLSQPLLLPYVKSVSPQEFAFLCKNFDILRSFGFEIEEFGSSSVKISSVPLDLFGMDADAFLNEALSSMESLRFIKLPDILRDRLASMACKAAVKGGEELSEREVQALISEMDGNMGLKCPHGRPACVKFKKSELEKLFKRTV